MISSMQLSQFHDGSLDGVLVSGTTVEFFLKSWDQRCFTLRLEGVEALNVDGFRKGNIILDVVVRERPAIMCADLIELFGYQNEADANAKLAQLDEKAFVIEINPSYGASCLVLALAAMLKER